MELINWIIFFVLTVFFGYLFSDTQKDKIKSLNKVIEDLNKDRIKERKGFEERIKLLREVIELMGKNK